MYLLSAMKAVSTRARTWSDDHCAALCGLHLAGKAIKLRKTFGLTSYVEPPTGVNGVSSEKSSFETIVRKLRLPKSSLENAEDSKPLHITSLTRSSSLLCKLADSSDKVENSTHPIRSPDIAQRNWPAYPLPPRAPGPSPATQATQRHDQTFQALVARCSPPCVARRCRNLAHDRKRKPEWKMCSTLSTHLSATQVTQ